MGLKEIFISLKLEFVGFVTARQQELEVFKHHWFHVKQGISIQLVQGLYLKRVEQFDLNDVRVNSRIYSKVEAQGMLDLIFLVSKRDEAVSVWLRKWNQIIFILDQFSPLFVEKMVYGLKYDLVVVFLVLDLHLCDFFPSLQVLRLFQLRIDDI